MAIYRISIKWKALLIRNSYLPYKCSSKVSLLFILKVKDNMVSVQNICYSLILDIFRYIDAKFQLL